MSLEADLFTSLTHHAGLAALIGARLYPDAVPQGATLPALVYQRISTPRQHAMGSGCPVVTSRPRLQFTCWATTAAGALSLCEQLRAALQASGYAVTFDNEWPTIDKATGYHARYLDAFVAHTGA